MLARPEHLVALTLSMALSTDLSGAETPIGLVDKVATGADGTRLVLAFDAAGSARLAPGQLVAIYGPGSMERHPLTGEVIIDRPRLVAKAQVVGIVGSVTARLRWLAPGAELAPGLDAVVLVNEPTPNAPPALTAEALVVDAEAGLGVVLNAPLADPDGDPLLMTWKLDGPAGQRGRLQARTSAQTSVVWLSPSQTPRLSGSVTLAWTASDPWGQSISGTVPLSTHAAGDLHARTLKILAKAGVGAEPVLDTIIRDSRGSWWGLAEGRLVRADGGWTAITAIDLPTDQSLKKPVALATRGDELYVLDAGRGQVLVLTLDAQVKRTIGGFGTGVALAAAPDGVLFVADREAVAVHVIEPDGTYRGRLGRAGSGKDGFQSVTALTCDRQGTLYLLDAAAKQLAVFDRFQRRQGTWSIPADEADPPVAIASHPKGVLVARKSGALAVLGDKGSVLPQRPSLAASGLVEDAGTCTGLGADALGETVLCLSEGWLHRFTPELESAGVRGAALRRATAAGADGSGALALLDGPKLRRFDAEGWCTQVVSAPGRQPHAVSLMADGSATVVLDRKGCEIHRLIGAADGKVFGTSGSNPGEFDDPLALAVDESGRIYVLDADLYRVTVFGPNGDLRFIFGAKGRAANEFYDPTQIAVSPDGTTCWVYDANSYELKRFVLDHQAKTGTHRGNAGGKGTAPGQFKSVIALGCDRAGQVYALDDSREDLQVLDLSGNNLHVVATKTFSDLGVPTAKSMTVAPDGWITIIGKGQLATWRW